MREQTDHDQFQIWLMEMDNSIDQLKASLPATSRSALDGSDASLDAVESLVLQRYADPQALLQSSELSFHDGMARYVGEIFRRRTGSKWSLDLTEPKRMFYGVPALTGGHLKASLCPLTMLTALADRRSGSYLSTILRNLSR